MPSCCKFNKGTNSANGSHDPFTVDHLPEKYLLSTLKGGSNAGQSVCREAHL